MIASELPVSSWPWGQACSGPIILNVLWEVQKRGRVQKAFYSRETDFLRETNLSKNRSVGVKKERRCLPCDEWLLAQTESESLREGELHFSDLCHLITSGRYQEGLGGLIIFIRGRPVSSLVGGGGALKGGQKGTLPSPPQASRSTASSFHCLHQ